jgi:hypothetical protein
MGILVDPSQRIRSHPSEEILEEYAFHRLPEALAAQVEEHLLLCPGCQDALAEVDRFVSALRIAASQPPSAVKAGRGWRTVFEAFSPAPKWAIPVAALALVILAVIAVRKNVPKPLAPVAVILSSVRGSDPLSPAPAGKPLHLSIETPDLIPGRDYRMELVDASGGLVWKGAATESAGTLAADVSEPLSAGVHWVRLYGANSELLREFGLLAK